MHDDHNPSLSFYGQNREKWYCFVCDKGGSTIDFVMEYTGINFVEACQWLCQAFGISIGSYPYTKRNFKVDRIKRKRIVNEEEKIFSRDVAEWIIDNNSLTEKGKAFLLEERFLKPTVIKQLNIVSIENSTLLVEKIVKDFNEKALKDSRLFTESNGMLYLKMFTPCLIFPFYDDKNNLIGIQSRYLGTNQKAPRFQFISGQKTRLFNLPILNTMRFGEDLYISEGVTDCLSLLSAGKKAIAIPSATLLPKFDLFKLRNYKLHMYPDQDKAGMQAYMNLKRFFVNHYTQFKAAKLPKGVKDYSEYYISRHGK